MKKRKAFTLVELVVVIGIICLGAAMVISTAVSLSSIQKTTADQNQKTSELSFIDRLCSKYISFVSVTNDDFSFSFDGCTDHNLLYSFSTYKFALQFNDANKTLSINSDYDGSVEYLKLTDSLKFKALNDISFKFDDSIGLFGVDVSFNNEIDHLSYVVRV